MYSNNSVDEQKVKFVGIFDDSQTAYTHLFSRTFILTLLDNVI